MSKRLLAVLYFPMLQWGLGFFSVSLALRVKVHPPTPRTLLLLSLLCLSVPGLLRSFICHQHLQCRWGGRSPGSPASCRGICGVGCSSGPPPSHPNPFYFGYTTQTSQGPDGAALLWQMTSCGACVGGRMDPHL